MASAVIASATVRIRSMSHVLELAVTAKSISRIEPALSRVNYFDPVKIIVVDYCAKQVTRSEDLGHISYRAELS
jgi:hypothetical protein